MNFEDSLVGVKGFLTIIKKYNDGREELLLKDRNMIVSGMGVAISDMFTAPDNCSVEDFQIDRFQVGVSGTASIVTSSVNELLGPLTSVNQYGEGSNLDVEIREQIINNAFKKLPAAKIPKSKINKLGNNTVRYTLVIDEEACNNLAVNGKEASLSEIGMLVKNPTLSHEDKPILVCYKTFNPVRKTQDFSLVFRWTIITSEYEAIPIETTYTLLNVIVQSGETELVPTGLAYGRPSVPEGTFEEFTEIDSTISYSTVPYTLNNNDPARRILRTGDLLSDKFQVLIPSAANYVNTELPLMVAFADFGQERSFATTFSALADELNSRDSFGVAPLGDSGIGNASKAMVYSAFSKEAINHTKAIVRYLIDAYPINKDKVYFYGFGVGGGHAASIAALQLDPTPSGWYPAAMVLHDAVLSNRFTWWYNAPSTLTSVSGTYPTPPNATMGALAKSITFWCASSYGSEGGKAKGTYYVRSLNYIPGVLTNNGIDGVTWNQVSGMTPDHKPYTFIETSPIEFNLNTSTDLWLSSCLLMNLGHIPTYVQFNTNNPSGPPVTLPNLMLSSFISGTSDNPYNIQVFNKQYSGVFANWQIHTSSTGTHNLSSINLTQALNYCYSKSAVDVLSGITIVGRSGEYWGIHPYGYVQKAEDGQLGYFGYGVPQIYADGGMPASANLWPSGLSVMYWSKDLNQNSITLSSTFLCQEDTKPFQSTILNVDKLGLQHGTSALPLIIKKPYTQTDRDATGITSSFTLANDYEYPHPWLDVWSSSGGARLGGLRDASYTMLEGYANAVILGWASSIRDTSTVLIEAPAGSNDFYPFEVPETLPGTGKVRTDFGQISPTVYYSSGNPVTTATTRISRYRKNGQPFSDDQAWRFLPNWNLTGSNALTDALDIAKVDKENGSLILTQRGMYIIYKP